MHDGSFASLRDVLASTRTDVRDGVHAPGGESLPGQHLTIEEIDVLSSWISRGAPAP